MTIKTLILQCDKLSIDEINKILNINNDLVDLILLDIHVNDILDLQHLNLPITLKTFMINDVFIGDHFPAKAVLFKNDNILNKIIKVPFCCEIIYLKNVNASAVKILQYPFNNIYKFNYINSHRIFDFETYFKNNTEEIKAHSITKIEKNIFYFLIKNTLKNKLN